MARYLTPASIGLLCLIELYTDSVVPVSSTVSILSFIVSHLVSTVTTRVETRVNGTDQAQNNGFTITIKEFENLLKQHTSASGMPGRSLWDAFLKKLWDINSLDALHVFFDQRSNLLQKPKEEMAIDAEMGIPPPSDNMILLSRTSPFGAYVRRAKVEFARLQFHDAASLWKSFTAYRQVTLTTWRKRNPQTGPWAFDIVMEQADEVYGQDVAQSFYDVAYKSTASPSSEMTGLISTKDVERLLEFQIEQMQKLGNRVPERVEEKFKSILETEIMIPSLSHYLKFLDSWRAGDYPSSFDHLHRFFDYTMQNRDRLFYQYALLNLAVLQADFGCYHEAVAAMQETVATARENKDMGCLNFSLSWLYHFGKAHPSIITAADKNNSMLSVEREGLTFLRLKAKESGMWSLWSSSLLSEAKLGLSNGESIALAFENILRSSQLNVTKNMMANVGSQMMLQSSLWSRLGITHLAWSYCEVFLRAHCTSAPFDDTLHFSCRAAYLLAQKGQYKAAHERLTRLDPNALRSLKASQYWLTFRGILQLQHDLHHHNLAGAELLLRQLLQNRRGDADLSFELDVLHIEYLMALGDLSRALSGVEELASNLQGEGEDVYFHVRLLIMKAYLFARCDRPQKGFSIAVRAATIAWRARLLPCLWEAMGVIANILRSLSEFPAAAEILEAVLPRALECDDAVLSAMLWGYWSDAQMGLAKMVEGRTRKTYLNKALEGVERTFDEYAKVEDHKAMREYTAKKAVILQALGEVGLAGDAAGKYMELLRTERESFTA